MRLGFKKEIVVPGDQNLVRVRLRAEPPTEGRDLGDGPAHGEIACVYQHIARRQLQSRLLIVGVGDQDQAQGLLSLERPKRG